MNVETTLPSDDGSVLKLVGTVTIVAPKCYVVELTEDPFFTSGPRKFTHQSIPLEGLHPNAEVEFKDALLDQYIEDEGIHDDGTLPW